MLNKDQKNQVKEVLTKETLMDAVFHKNGLITAKKKFNSLAGRTSEMYAEKIKKVIPNAEIKRHEIVNDSVKVEFTIKEECEHDYQWFDRLLDGEGDCYDVYKCTKCDKEEEDISDINAPSV